MEPEEPDIESCSSACGDNKIQQIEKKERRGGGDSGACMLE